MSFANYRNSNANNISSLQDKIKNINNGGRKPQLDETYWTYKHILGPDGFGEAIIRFLPPPPSGDSAEPDPVVKYFVYSKYDAKTNSYYKERGRNSLSDDELDPANEYNMSIFAKKDTMSKEKMKPLLINRDQRYVANIFVVKDPFKPENNGKVFRMEFGYKIFKMIEAKLLPQYETEVPVDIFDPVTGADFYLRVEAKKIGNNTVPNYDASKFGEVSKRWDYEEFDSIWKQEHSLQSEIAESKFKSYDELNQIFNNFLARITVKENKKDAMNPVGYDKIKEENAAVAKEENSIDETAFDGIEELKQETPVTHTDTDDSFFDDL